MLGALLAQDLHEHWTVVGSVGKYIVYRNNDWPVGNK
jgi:hypothetical protein